MNTSKENLYCFFFFHELPYRDLDGVEKSAFLHSARISRLRGPRVPLQNVCRAHMWPVRRLTAFQRSDIPYNTVAFWGKGLSSRRTNDNEQTRPQSISVSINTAVPLLPHAKHAELIESVRSSDNGCRARTQLMFELIYGRHRRGGRLMWGLEAVFFFRMTAAVWLFLYRDRVVSGVSKSINATID